jgi:hypothetical protein
MQVNEGKIAFICFHLFFRIEPFQRVTSEKNKKIPCCLNSPPGLRSNVSNSTQPRSSAQPSPSPVNESSSIICSTIFWFWQEKTLALIGLAVERPRLRLRLGASTVMAGA